jgi:hypothetical protein
VQGLLLVRLVPLSHPGRKFYTSGLGASPAAGAVSVPSGNEIYTTCFGRSRLDLQDSFDAILI